MSLFEMLESLTKKLAIMSKHIQRIGFSICTSSILDDLLAVNQVVMFDQLFCST